MVNNVINILLLLKCVLGLRASYSLSTCISNNLYINVHYDKRFVLQQTLHISVLHEVCATTLVEAAE